MLKSGVDRQRRSRQRIPLVLTIPLRRISHAVIGSPSEEPPLSLGELIESSQVGTATTTFSEELLSPLIEHPSFVNSGEVSVFLRVRGVLEITVTNLQNEVLRPGSISCPEFAFSEGVIDLRPTELDIVDVLEIFSFGLGVDRVPHKAHTRVGLTPTRRHNRLEVRGYDRSL